MPRSQFNHSDGDADALKCSPALMTWLNRSFAKLKHALPGPVLTAKGTITANLDVDLSDVSLMSITLGANVTLTLLGLPTVRGGAEAKLELTQDATGSRVVTWVNATGTGGAVTAPTATANKKTLYLATYTGSTWVLTVLASNF